MVIKGSARAAPGELAYHLLREDTNEAVRVMEFSGVASLDLREALVELDGMGAGSRSRRTLYHASINTPVSEQLNEEQQRAARQRLAVQLGLAGQPFAMVEHVKAGRQHTHVVWSRIDIETGKAIPDSHNYRKHEEVSRELELEFGHGPVIGAHVRDKETQPRPERGPTWAEQRQTERSGMTPAAAKAVVTALWRQTTTGRDFLHRLEAEGFIVARGDRRDFVLIDQAGEVHGLTRRIEGVKAAEVRQRMAEIDAGQLPDVDDARRQLRLRQQGHGNASAMTFTNAAERLRADELKREAEATGRTGPKLRNSDQEAADALWQLNRTMRGEMAITIAPLPTQEQRQAFRTELAARPEPTAQRSPRQDAVREEKPTQDPRREKQPLLQRLFGRGRGKVQEAPPAPITKNTAIPPQPEGMKVAGKVAEAIRRPSIGAENRPDRENRPSAYLFVRIFGYLVETYQHAFERAVEPEKHESANSRERPESRRPAAQVSSAVSPTRPDVSPEREDLYDQVMRQRANRTDAEKEAARAAAQLRQEHGRKRDRGHELNVDE